MTISKLVLPIAISVSAMHLAGATDRPEGGETGSAVDLFNERIVPIFRSPQPSSCVQCHLASVDLKDYILPSHRKTFLSLRDQGLVDLKQPEKSKILKLISMGERDLDEGAKLIHAKMRRAEYEAFAAWITACARDPELRNLPALDESERAAPDKPDAVIRHARKSRVVDSFARNVWSQRMRCFPCHTPFEIDPADPKQAAAVKKQREFEQKYPELVDRLKLFRETPEETLDYLIEASRNAKDGDLPLVNVEAPEQSLLVLKPLSKVPPKNADGKMQKPSSALPVSHMGGLKMHPNDHSYKSFMQWLTDYARVAGDDYKSADDLPADNWQGTNRILRLTEAPEQWRVGSVVQLFVYSRNEAGNGWSDKPVAFTQGSVTPRHMVNGALFLFARGEPGSRVLERGRYLVRVYHDQQNRLTGDPTLLLNQNDLMGSVEIDRARWREGFRQAETASWSRRSQTKE